MGKIFFLIKTKQKLFRRIAETLLYVNKNFTKTKLQTNLISLTTVRAPRSLERIEQLDPIQEQFRWQIFIAFIKIFSIDIFSIYHEL